MSGTTTGRPERCSYFPWVNTSFRPRILLAPIASALLVLGGFLALFSAPRLSPAIASAEARTLPHGFVEMEVRDVIPLKEADTHAVVLVAQDGTVLPIFVDESSAMSIALQLAHKAPPHPLANDLMNKMMTGLGGTLTEVRIDAIQDQIYMGRVFIRQGGKKLELSARPSDSIAMALTQGAHIFASQKVLAEAGITRKEIDKLRKELHHEQDGVGGSGPGPGTEIEL